jgi:hypothetical protein
VPQRVAPDAHADALPEALNDAQHGARMKPAGAIPADPTRSRAEQRARRVRPIAHGSRS